ncbi:tryptophan--tRNA ligase [Neisseria sp. Ec49-e6-T10]|uniref:tryptophan--tRNA ligase n=1 Tax=Neisseria sp. Ec49-e6-T10 TaxID=3140744 RepID=UPI003EC0783B
MSQDIILSGMRPTGKLHLGHYHGVLKNWVAMQQTSQCYFMVADLHALTTAYEDPSIIKSSIWDMVIDWLAAGLDPEKAAIFIQSKVPQHAELHLALSMVTPLSWLERVPTYKDQITKLTDKDLGTYGFLGYPVLMSADILLYRATKVPVGEDQIPHVEICREIARRFNHFYGKEPNYEELAQALLKKMGKVGKEIAKLRTAYLQNGDEDALKQAHQLVLASQNVNSEEKNRLFGFIENKGRSILYEPEVSLTKASKMPGLDGAKMSKSYGNTITMREDPQSVSKKIRAMPTDPARVRRTDPGDPEKCPVWQFHLVYSSEETKQWVKTECPKAGIGCIDCKQPLIESVVAEQQPIFERAQKYLDNPALVQEIVLMGSEKARKAAQTTMNDVRAALGLEV